ncbi:MAG: YMGG-like glycine zipper-containing protein [Pseudomonadota bacterium]
MKKCLFVLLGLGLLTACASDPIVDMRGVDQARYDADLAECRSYANQVKTGEQAVTQGAIGAAVGSVLGAVIGDSDLAQRGAGVGAVSGTTRGASKALNRKEQVVMNCLRGRGYKVLG